MKSRVGFFLFVFVFLVFGFSFLSSQVFLKESLKKDVTFNISQNFYVADLIKVNPEIESVSYFEGNQTVGYLNVLGGVGENFVIYPNFTYEVVLNQNISLKLPY